MNEGKETMKREEAKRSERIVYFRNEIYSAFFLHSIIHFNSLRLTPAWIEFELWMKPCRNHHSIQFRFGVSETQLKWLIGCGPAAASIRFFSLRSGQSFHSFLLASFQFTSGIKVIITVKRYYKDKRYLIIWIVVN